MVKGLWWKLLGAFIFLFVLIGGMTTPLKPGITSVSPSQAISGQKVRLNIFGYNTHFKEAGTTSIWLKLDSTRIIANTALNVLSDNQVEAEFILPCDLQATEKVVPLTLLFDNQLDGGFVSPNALFVTQVDSIPENPIVAWQDASKLTFHTVSGLKFPYRSILNETIRNTFFHVALWFAMFVLLMIGLYHAVMYLITKNMKYDTLSSSYNRIGILYGILGILTGSIWAKFTWNSFWTTDVKLNMSAIAMLIYLAYLVLRNTSADFDRRAKMSAAYTIFAFAALIPLVFVIPRMTDSLHPGNGGNPALGGEDLDNTLRIFFYPSIIALILMGLWMTQLLVRFHNIEEKVLLKSNKM